MIKKVVLTTVLMIVLISMLCAPVNAQFEGIIYIRADGSVEGTDKIQRDGDVYVFVDNIQEAIFVEKDHIVVDGAGYSVKRTETYYPVGIELTGRINVTIKNIEITGFLRGIHLSSSSNNALSGNHITNNDRGIWLEDSSNNVISGNHITLNKDEGILLGYSSNNVISGNNVTDSNYPIWLDNSPDNTISGNTVMTSVDEGIYIINSSNNNVISGNMLIDNVDGIHVTTSSNNAIYDNHITGGENYGIALIEASKNEIYNNNITQCSNGMIIVWGSSNNNIYKNNITKNQLGLSFDTASNNVFTHNNFVDNIKQVENLESTNVFDDGYPSGGNYWSDYTGVDKDEDGIGDTQYVVATGNQDEYPLIRPYGTPWSPPEPPVNGEIKGETPIWMQWWFWAIIIAGIAVLVGVAYFFIKKMRP